jgi:hypothetical protein
MQNRSLIAFCYMLVSWPQTFTSADERGEGGQQECRRRSRRPSCMSGVACLCVDPVGELEGLWIVGGLVPYLFFRHSSSFIGGLVFNCVCSLFGA